MSSRGRRCPEFLLYIVSICGNDSGFTMGPGNSLSRPVSPSVSLCPTCLPLCLSVSQCPLLRSLLTVRSMSLAVVWSSSARSLRSRWRWWSGGRRVRTWSCLETTLTSRSRCSGSVHHPRVLQHRRPTHWLSLCVSAVSRWSFEI